MRWRRLLKIRRVIFGVVVVCVFGTAVFGQPWSGSGTAEDPYQIWDANDMQAIGADVNYWDKHFRLMDDIDLSDYNGVGSNPTFNIIGNITTKFTGVFNGNGYKISNFKYNSTGVNRIGIFGFVLSENARIQKLTLILPNVNAGTGSNVGALAGMFYYGQISECCIEGGTISSSGGYIGALVGRTALATIVNCGAFCNVSGENNVGGLIGNAGVSTIDTCYSNGTVSCPNDRVGGLVGTSSSKISNCYSHADVQGIEDVGGLVGSFMSTIVNCYSTGIVSGSGGTTGGLAGENYDARGTITNSFWDVNSSGQTTSNGGTGKTTAEMQTRSTFTDAGWDFVGEVVNGPNDIWRMCVDGVNYPMFVWQFPSGDFECPDGVTLIDFSVFGEAWLSEPNYPNWDPNCDISEPNDNIIDEQDLSVFVENWLMGI